ncbi:MAG: hypothetical protein ACJA2S_002520 [Cyclobacteriaceae bacterium]|jgi:hypothetical protein
MEIKKKVQGVNLIKFLLVFFRIIFFISVLATILGIIIKGISLSTNSGPMKTVLPVLFSIAKDSSLLDLGGDGISNLKVTWGLGFVSASALPKSFDLLFFLTKLLSFSCGLLFLRLIISILETVEFGDFLISRNAIRLRWISVLGLVYVFLYSIELAISHIYLKEMVDLPGFNIINVIYYTYISSGWIFICLFILVLAEVFKVGALLKEESELTI